MKSINIAKETREVFISKISTIENLSHGKAVPVSFIALYHLIFSKNDCCEFLISCKVS